MMRIEREDQEPRPVDNPFTFSTSPINMLKNTSMPESDPGTKRILTEASLEEGEISDQTTTSCSSKERNNVKLRDQTVFYNPSTFNLKSLKVKLMNLIKKHDSYKNCEKDAVDYFSFWRKPIHAIHKNIEYCLENFGLWCAREVAQIHMENHEIDSTADRDTVSSNDIKIEYLREACKILNDAFPSALKNNGNIGEANLFGVKEGSVTPKIHAFMRYICLGEYKDMSCVVTVENMLSAIAISMFMKSLDYFEYKYTYGDYLVGSIPIHANGLKMKQNSPKFCGFDKVHIFFTMNGIDAQKYDYIIHFDLPKTIRSYILSCEEVGQSKPSYIALLERGNTTQQDLFYNLITDEYLACQKCCNPFFSQADSQEYAISDEGRMISERADVEKSEEALLMEVDMDELYRYLDLKEGKENEMDGDFDIDIDKCYEDLVSYRDLDLKEGDEEYTYYKNP